MPVPLLIGIDPPHSLKSTILDLKSVVLDSCGSQNLVAEAPHLTFVGNNFTDTNSVADVLAQIQFPKIEIMIDGVTYFPPKKMSSKYVVYLNVKRNDALQKLQQKIVELTSPYHQGCAMCVYLAEHMPNYKYTATETKNAKKYGFPYVGSGWQPHFTIGELDKTGFDKIGETLLKTKVQQKFVLNQFVLFRHQNGWRPYRSYILR
ncbi:MAG: 2'-5' RNA ligase family protein [Candidatus Aenigmarchaeota archaeon]|nr:2'-5' RNA ligase family protein [Candidatus Aenigmarchaeota archaeon]